MERFNSYQLDTKPVRTKRIERLYQYIKSFQSGICVERARYLTEFYEKEPDLPNVLKRAKAVQHVLRNMTIYIMPDSLFAGNQASNPRWAPLFPEFEVEWMEAEFLKGNPYFPGERPADQYILREEDLDDIRHICRWWKGQTHTDRLRNRLPKEALLTHYEIKAADIGAYFQGGDGHFATAHEWLINNGLEEIIRQAQAGLDQLDWREGPDVVKKRDFYTAAIVTAESVIEYAERCAKLAEDQVLIESDSRRKEELAEMAATCRWVPRHPARTFKEALQFIIITHICLHIEDNGVGISFGRFDQFMYPFYKADVKAERIDRETAVELVENFFLQIYTSNKVRSWGDTDFFRGVPMFQNLTIGGQDRIKKCDATNELSYICLDAIYHTRIPQPSLTVRFHNNSPFEFKMKVAEVIRLGTGLPSIFNDETYIPALLNRGYELDDAYDYCIIGCVEPGPAGLLGGRTGGAWLNCVKGLEMALYNGTDPRTGICLHPNSSSRDLATFEDFAEVQEAYMEQMRYYVRMEAILENTIDQLWEEHMNESMTSVFGGPTTTLKRGKTFKQGGAKYDYTGQQTIGTANVANSLFAIKKLIFEDRRITGAQLKHALESNFSDQDTSPTGPQIKAMCQAVPKYGNDIDEVDDLARDMLAFIANELCLYKNTRYGKGPIGGTLHCSTSTVSSNTPFGKVCGAMPDGREAYTPVADGQSPMKGTDINGPTAAIRSVSKINNILLSCGSLYNLKFNPSDLY
ncbi:glycyl radical protein [Robinsoniella peoriensis]|uniref:glycyl radical protein n=1 Tax=Robinsoniella peoriensis TaxID=180332 RepID=UPI00085C8EE2|nr:pyruvate formate lyase family protein [Robinsoniella peoriensis]